MTMLGHPHHCGKRAAWSIELLHCNLTFQETKQPSHAVVVINPAPALPTFQLRRPCLNPIAMVPLGRRRDMHLPTTLMLGRRHQRCKTASIGGYWTATSSSRVAFNNLKLTMPSRCSKRLLRACPPPNPALLSSRPSKLRHRVGVIPDFGELADLSVVVEPQHVSIRRARRLVRRTGETICNLGSMGSREY